MSEVPAEDYVLLGVVDELIPSSNASFLVNKVGGKPDFGESNFNGSPACEICGKCQLLSVQVYCPLDDSPHHRTLYVFCCADPVCWSKSSGWTVLRVLTGDGERETNGDEGREKYSSVSPLDAANQTWGGVADDDWGEETGVTLSDFKEDSNRYGKEGKERQLLDDLSNEIKNVTLLNGGNAGCKLLLPDDEQPAFKAYYVNVFDEYECICRSEEQKLPSTCAFNEAKELDSSGFGEDFKVKPESYERSEHSDEIFHKFWKKNRICPEQVIRYSRHGKPLRAKGFEEKIPHCSCGAPRSYEMQLMPGLLPYMVSRSVSVEFSTVLVYTCSANCSPEGNSIFREHVVYQDDPDLSYFKGQKRS